MAASGLSYGAQTSPDASANAFPQSPTEGDELPQDQWSAEGSGGENNGDAADNDDSKKRKRPMSVSCELCKQRKVKCDRGQPACGWCVKNGALCEYKERKKPGLRAGYGRELEARLDRLEGMIMQHSQVLNQLLNGSQPPTRMMDGINNQTTSPAAQSVTSPSTAAGLPAQEANVFAGPANIQTSEFPSNHARVPSSSERPSPIFSSHTPSTADYHRELPDYTQGYSQAGQESYAKHDPALLQQDPQYYVNGGIPLANGAMDMNGMSSINNQSLSLDMPPYDILYSLTDLYFKHINTWCPILHRKTTFEALFGSPLEEADKVVLNAIVATTLRFSTDARLTPELRDRYYNASKQQVLAYGMEKSSVKALQAMVILALDICGSSNGPPGWNLLAVIIRSAVQLGLSVESSSPMVSPKTRSIYTLRAMVLPEAASFIDDESRRRLFFMIYILDRYTTLTTAFDFALDHSVIDRKLPCRDDLFGRNQAVDTRWFRKDMRADAGVDKPENLGSFSYYIEVVDILSRIHLWLKKPLDIGVQEDVTKWQDQYRKLASMLNDWKENIPQEYGRTDRLFDSSAGNKIVNCGWVMLHATYHTTIMRLHSSAAYPACSSNYFKASNHASECCLKAVDSISALCNHVRNNGMLNKLGAPFAFSVWVAARLLLVHSTMHTHTIDTKLQFFVNTLRELGTYWNVASRYATLLQRVLDEYAESEQTSEGYSGSGRNTTPSSVKILADMRRCAFDLDFLISRQPHESSPGASNSVASSRMPASNEAEYYDVFGFFNMPRLPMSMDNILMNGSNGIGFQTLGMLDPTSTNEYGVSNFGLDASSDWLLQGS